MSSKRDMLSMELLNAQREYDDLIEEEYGIQKRLDDLDLPQDELTSSQIAKIKRSHKEDLRRTKHARKKKEERITILRYVLE